MIISIINHKGGVGKTMTTHNLGAALAQMKKRVLMVDFDPQCNLTQHCGVDTTAPMTTISDYLNDDDREYLPIEVNKYLHLIPSADGLDADSMNMAAMDDPVEAATLLRTILGRVGEGYDYILVDGAPGSGMLMLNALYAADEIIIPMSDKDSMLGVAKIGKLIQANHLHPRAHYLITRHDTRLTLCNELRDHLVAECPELTYHTIIRSTEALRQAACNGQDVFTYAPKSNGAADYKSLAKEVAGKRSGKLS